MPSKDNHISSKKRCVCPELATGTISETSGANRKFLAFEDSKVCFKKGHFDIASHIRIKAREDYVATWIFGGYAASYDQICDKGLLVCNSNCAIIGLVIPAAALIQKFGPIDQVSMVTIQAVSGRIRSRLSWRQQ
ncbi:hypothetical protein FGG08_004941 [Glutinoglossum americanum]|uniref:Uncharacterized protein n=1 Tax=Glutinoglossum americanum TaxID=1670608 RepID=A0A9P8I433_9PEZI|nr:hypothetical protein FGG08_004941 [Glutinoglossum americanum]